MLTSQSFVPSVRRRGQDKRMICHPRLPPSPLPLPPSVTTKTACCCDQQKEVRNKRKRNKKGIRSVWSRTADRDQTAEERAVIDLQFRLAHVNLPG